MTRRQAALVCTGALGSWAAESRTHSGDRIRIGRLPERGLQPQMAMDDRGTLHLVYYTGDARQGDLYYVYSRDDGGSFSPALRVNSQPGSAIAAGTIRGAQLALGAGGRVHIAWNGSMAAEPKAAGAPMLYTRLNDAGDRFEPQRNLMRHSSGLDGGGSVAADRAGNVYVAWHGIGDSGAMLAGQEGEARRQVWITKSEDGGRSFSKEKPAWAQPTGACACCGLKIFAGRQGSVSVLYRSATESVHRDIYCLISTDQARSFHGGLLDKWELNACPMSSMDLAENGRTLVGAWERAGQVYWARLEAGGGPASVPFAAPGQAKARKHPRIAINQNGAVLLVWTEGTGWQKGGSLAWQLYDPAGQPSGKQELVPGIPAWSFGSVAARPDGAFSILY